MNCLTMLLISLSLVVGGRASAVTLVRAKSSANPSVKVAAKAKVVAPVRTKIATKMPKYEPIRVSVKASGQVHLYRLLQQGSVFTLMLEKGRQPPQKYALPEYQANALKSEATRIVWNNEYRGPASNKKCTEYAWMESGGHKSRICLENATATGKTLGLLNRMGKLFR